MFKTANPSSRLPAYLQNGTTENVVFQFGTIGVFLVFLGVKGWWDDRELRKLRKH